MKFRYNENMLLEKASIRPYIPSNIRRIYESYDRNFFRYLDEAMENYAIYKALNGGKYKINEFLVFLNKTTNLITEGIFDNIKNFVKKNWEKAKAIFNKIKGWVLSVFVIIKNIIKNIKSFVKISKDDVVNNVLSEDNVDKMFEEFKKKSGKTIDIDDYDAKSAILLGYGAIQGKDYVDANKVIFNQSNKIAGVIKNVTGDIESLEDIEEEDLEKVPDQYVSEKISVKRFIKELNEIKYSKIFEQEDDVEIPKSRVQKVIQKVINVIIGPVKDYVNKVKNYIEEIRSATAIPLPESKNSRYRRYHKIYESADFSKIKYDDKFVYKMISSSLISYAYQLSKKEPIKESKIQRIFESDPGKKVFGIINMLLFVSPFFIAPYAALGFEGAIGIFASLLFNPYVLLSVAFIVAFAVIMDMISHRNALKEFYQKELEKYIEKGYVKEEDLEDLDWNNLKELQKKMLELRNVKLATV